MLFRVLFGSQVKNKLDLLSRQVAFYLVYGKIVNLFFAVYGSEGVVQA
jgi:hypothetical protein